MNYGDSVGGHLDDISIDKFNGVGGIGLQFINRGHWTERTVLTHVTLGQSVGNTTNGAFTISDGTNSFGYTRALDTGINLYKTTVTSTAASVTLTSGSTTATVTSGGSRA